MRDRQKAVEHRADHALGRRIVGDEFGVFGLDSLQFLEQPVVFGVGDLRVIEHVIAVRVTLQLFAKERRALRGIGWIG